MSAPGLLPLTCWWGALLLVLMVTGRAPAAEPSHQQASREESVPQLPPVHVIAPGALPEALPRSWMPGAVDILQGAGIGTSRPVVLPDLLERLPGVTLQNEQGNPLQPTLTHRG